ncbi:SHOCT domain-containing protein [Peribacillus simplex]|uniref:SHOCT domain-containing protein n=1 Tax=Peribacillus simplex TaxID=1478 RepID=A0A8B5XZJ9_9BACI|nr:SHOCT domain-containing protein [Peribacillus simplex]
MERLINLKEKSIEQLKELAKLKDQGIMTKEEFQRKKITQFISCLFSTLLKSGKLPTLRGPDGFSAQLLQPFLLRACRDIERWVLIELF